MQMRFEPAPGTKTVRSKLFRSTTLLPVPTNRASLNEQDLKHGDPAAWRAQTAKVFRPPCPRGSVKLPARGPVQLCSCSMPAHSQGPDVVQASAANARLRKELAHITWLRDNHRLSLSRFGQRAALNVAPSQRSGGKVYDDGVQIAVLPPEYSAPTATQEPERLATSGSRGIGTARSQRLGATRGATATAPGHSRPATSQGPAPGGLMLSREELRKVLGTESRPSTVLQVIRRRQCHADLHMMWSVSPNRRFDAYQSRVEGELGGSAVQPDRERYLKKLLRKRIRKQMIDTRKLARNLWDYFKLADVDGSGRIEFAEFSQIMTMVGLGTEEMGGRDMMLALFGICDKDRNGSIDFNEFLKAIVGNICNV
jgi:hypothetical protein